MKKDQTLHLNGVLAFSHEEYYSFVHLLKGGVLSHVDQPDCIVIDDEKILKFNKIAEVLFTTVIDKEENGQ